MTDAKLSKLVEFYGKKLDVHSQVDSDYNRGCYVGFSIAKAMTERIIHDILERQLEDIK